MGERSTNSRIATAVTAMIMEMISSWFGSQDLHAANDAAYGDKRY
jgi:hypothetical protein